MGILPMRRPKGHEDLPSPRPSPGDQELRQLGKERSFVMSLYQRRRDVI